jgi:hypothetical protein
MSDSVRQMTEIQVQINELHKRQAELREEEKAEKIVEIRKMDWLKGKTVQFEHGMVAAGLPEYRLSLGGGIPLLEGVITDWGGSVCLYGDHSQYENNITLRRNDSWGFCVYTMETSNGKTLAKFIKENKLKIGGFSPNRRAVYSTILENLAD